MELPVAVISSIGIDIDQPAVGRGHQDRPALLVLRRQVEIGHGQSAAGNGETRAGQQDRKQGQPPQGGQRRAG